MIKNKFKYTGFTLAEVLIVIGIIGIVAELTIPTLLQNYRISVTETRLMTAYSILNNMIKLSANDNGNPDTWDIQNTGYDVNAFFNTYFMPYIKFNGKKFEDDATSFTAYDISGNYEYMDNTRTSKVYYMANGTGLAFIQGATIGRTRRRGSFFILTDPDASKKVIGKNVFQFNLIVDPNLYSVTAGQDYPDPTTFSCSIIESNPTVHAQTIAKCKNSTMDTPFSGLSQITCTALIECNSWKIPTDYPIRF